jgi:hypothetical protein
MSPSGSSGCIPDGVRAPVRERLPIKRDRKMKALDRKIAARRALDEEADDLFVFLCALEGGDAEVECTEARHEVRLWVTRHPRYDKAARAAILR